MGAQPELETAPAAQAQPREEFIGLERRPTRARVISVVSRKGGSGKSTTAINLAGALVEQGHRVLIVDLDPQASLSRSLKVQANGHRLSRFLELPGPDFVHLIRPAGAQGLYLVPSDPELGALENRRAANNHIQAGLRECLARHLPESWFEYVLIDCPPSLTLLTSCGMLAAREIIIPVDGSTYSAAALSDTLAAVRLMQQRMHSELRLLGILVGNVNQRTIFDRAMEETLRELFGPAVFRTVISTSIVADEAAQLGKPIVFYAPQSKLAEEYRHLAREVVRRRPSDE